MKSQSGQALVESLITYFLLFLVSFSVIELVRLQTFKMLFQVSVNYYAKYIALDEMSFIRNQYFANNPDTSFASTKLEAKIQYAIQKDLARLGTSLVSFEADSTIFTKHQINTKIDLIKDHKKYKTQNESYFAGVHLKATTCLPVLFSSFLNRFTGPEKVVIGRKTQDDPFNRDCLGQFFSSNKAPKIWFRVRAAGYSPWPASTQIFYHGIGIPKKFKLIDQNQRELFLKSFENIEYKNVFSK